MEAVDYGSDPLEVPTIWQRLLPFMSVADNGDTLVHYLYDDTDYGPGETFVSRTVSLTFSPTAWALGAQAENVDLSAYRRDRRLLSLTLSLGPFHLTASHERGQL